MRRRALAALALAAGGLLLAVLAPHLPGERGWNVLAGLLLVAAIVLGLSLLPFWRGLMPPLPPMEGLFTVPRGLERWCARCGNPTARRGPCRECGHTPRPPRGERQRT